MLNRPHMTWFEAGRNEWKNERVQTSVHGQICLSRPGQARPGPVDELVFTQPPRETRHLMSHVVCRCQKDCLSGDSVADGKDEDRARIARPVVALWARQSLA